MMQSLLSKVKKSDIYTEPFPHIIIKDPIDPQLCSELIWNFPPIEIVAKGAPIVSNQRFSYCAKDCLRDININPIWKEFVNIHVSQFFLNEFTFLFKQHIREMYPSLLTDMGEEESWKAGIRNIDNFSNADVLLDAQISINTPVSGRPSSVRGGHIDLPNKLFAGLYYLRHPQDKSTGGDLEIYTFKNHQERRFKGQFIDDKHIQLVNTVKYQSNVFVLLLNSIKSLHGVSVRSITQEPRLFFNLVGEVNRSLFNIEDYQMPKTFLNNWFGFGSKAVR